MEAITNEVTKISSRNFTRVLEGQVGIKEQRKQAIVRHLTCDRQRPPFISTGLIFITSLQFLCIVY